VIKDRLNNVFFHPKVSGRMQIQGSLSNITKFKHNKMFLDSDYVKWCMVDSAEEFVPKTKQH
jgi:hypothetical protein